jgi:hypothetical protein
MARIAESIIIHKRGNSFQFTLNSTCGLPFRVCSEWQRQSFKTLPDEREPVRIWTRPPKEGDEKLALMFGTSFV